MKAGQMVWHLTQTDSIVSIIQVKVLFVASSSEDVKVSYAESDDQGDYLKRRELFPTLPEALEAVFESRNFGGTLKAVV